MEVLLLYLDDIDDLIGTIGLLVEPLRRLLLKLAALVVSLLSLASGVLLAIVHPPLALATSVLLFVTLVILTATTAPRGRPHPT